MKTIQFIWLLKKILNHEDVNYDLQNLVLKSIFENINKDSKKN